MYLQAENAVSSFFFYMWNAWSEEECKAVYGNMYPHFWEKWCVAADKGTFGAAERFYLELSEDSRRLLVEQAVDIAREIYLSMTVDPVSGTALLMGCAEGGVDIESLAATQPEKIVRVHVDMAEGLGGYHVNNLIYGMGLSGEEAKQVGAAARGLLNLKGHRIAGGMRASLYNAMPMAGVDALVDYLKQFEVEHHV